MILKKNTFFCYFLLPHLFFSLTDLRTAFDLLDRNQDGRVTANELQFMLKNLGIVVRDELIDDLIKEASHGGKYIFCVLLTMYCITKSKTFSLFVTKVTV